MGLATLQFERKLQNCIRMGITIFKFFIWEGISSDIWSEIKFYGSLALRHKSKFPTVYPMIYLPKWKIWTQLSPKTKILRGLKKSWFFSILVLKSSWNFILSFITLGPGSQQLPFPWILGITEVRRSKYLWRYCYLCYFMMCSGTCIFSFCFGSCSYTLIVLKFWKQFNLGFWLLDH